MSKFFLILFFFAITVHTATAATDSSMAPDPEFDEILSRDLHSLSVTSVSKRPQRLSDTATAVYVVTQEQIRRAGIYSIPDALRMVPGLQVAKLARDRWAVTARGFNSSTSNKLLVLIDGRAIYTPVFSGVYWGDQGTSINDIDRIEVIRGPGASLYGANAVNGVINIITKSAEDTQGNLASTTATIHGNGLYEARHGGAINNRNFYRVYGQYLDAQNWYRARSGFRMDGSNDSGNSYTLQGDAYIGNQDASLSLPVTTSPFRQTFHSTDDVYGGNVLGRWKHDISNREDLTVQTYLDHYSRVEYNADQHVSVGDIQFQHNLQYDSHNFIWGAGARLSRQVLMGTFWASANEEVDNHHTLNLFVQDEYALLPETLFFTAGSKFEYNDLTGVEVQPTARLAWHPTDHQTVWGAVSRAVRTPSNIEEDVDILGAVTTGPTELRIIGNTDQKAEELIAYEIGHRIQPTNDLSFDTTLFYNVYDRLQAIDRARPNYIGPSGNTVMPFVVSNLGSGHVFGGEIASTWNVNNDWRLAGSYAYLEMDLDVKPESVITLESTEALAPKHQFSIQSYYNISESVHWDNMLYYVHHLSRPVDNYWRYDTRIAWLVQPGLEVSLIGRNLIESHIEFPSSPQKVERSLIGQVLWKF